MLKHTLLLRNMPRLGWKRNRDGNAYQYAYGASIPIGVSQRMVATRVKAKGSKRAKVLKGKKVTKFRNYKYKPTSGLKDLLKMTNPYMRWDFVFPENHLVHVASTPGVQTVFGPIPNAAYYDYSVDPTNNDQTALKEKSLKRQSLAWLTVEDLRTIYQKLVGDVSAGKLFTNLYDAPPGTTHEMPQGHEYTHSDKWPTVYCHGYTHQLTMQNPNATTCYVELWTLTPRPDHDTMAVAPQDYWQYNLDHTGSGHIPDYGLNQLPTNDHKPQHQILHNINEPGARPSNQGMSCNEFWDNFFLIGKARYKLEAGSSCTHVYKVPGFKITHEMLYREGTGHVVPGLTCLTMGFLIGEKGFDNHHGPQDVTYLDANVTMRARAFSSWSVKMWNRSNFRITTNDVFSVTHNDTSATHKIHHVAQDAQVMRVDPPNQLTSQGFVNNIANADS